MSYSNNIQCLLNLDKDASENEVMTEIQKIVNMNSASVQPTKIITEIKQQPQQQPSLLESIFSSNNSQNTGPESISQNVLNNEEGSLIKRAFILSEVFEFVARHRRNR
jgi:hypothetical protein